MQNSISAHTYVQSDQGFVVCNIQNFVSWQHIRKIIYAFVTHILTQEYQSCKVN